MVEPDPEETVSWTVSVAVTVTSTSTVSVASTSTVSVAVTVTVGVGSARGSPSSSFDGKQLATMTKKTNPAAAHPTFSFTEEPLSCKVIFQRIP